MRTKTVQCLLALLALVHVQVFGAVQAYLCPCAPELRAVPEIHCHGAECHPGHDHQDGCPSDAETENHSGTHSHRHLTLHDGSNDGTMATGSDRLPAPATVVCWVAASPGNRVPGAGPVRQHPAPMESPPLPATIARSTVRLI